MTVAADRQWLGIRKAVRILHRILKYRLAGQEPAPWIIPPADPVEAEWENAAHRHRRTARTFLTMLRALLSGDLTAYLVNADRSVALPGWAWENEKASLSAFDFNRISLNPLLDHGLPECGDWRCFVSRAEFKAWVSEPGNTEIGDLPTLPAPFDHNLKPDQCSYREPPKKTFIELTQALTWIAFAVSLSHDEFGFMETCRFGPFEQSDWSDTLRDALADFADQASGGSIRVRGRYVANYSDHAAVAHADTEYITDTQLRDFACFESLHGGLERGTGLVWEADLFDHALNGRNDGWRDVEVCRAELLKAFPPRVFADDPSVRVTSIAGAEQECRDWLAMEFVADPEGRRTKADFRSAALAAFPGRLTGRGFNLRVWPALAQLHGRDKAGAKKKS